MSTTISRKARHRVVYVVTFHGDMYDRCGYLAFLSCEDAVDYGRANKSSEYHTFEVRELPLMGVRKRTGKSKRTSPY